MRVKGREGRHSVATARRCAIGGDNRIYGGRAPVEVATSIVPEYITRKIQEIPSHVGAHLKFYRWEGLVNAGRIQHTIGGTAGAVLFGVLCEICEEVTDSKCPNAGWEFVITREVDTADVEVEDVCLTKIVGI